MIVAHHPDTSFERKDDRFKKNNNDNKMCFFRLNTASQGKIRGEKFHRNQCELSPKKTAQNPQESANEDLHFIRRGWNSGKQKVGTKRGQA